MRPTADPAKPRKELQTPEAGPTPIVPFVTPPAPSHLDAVGARVWAEVWEYGGDVYAPSDGYIIERYAALHERRSKLMDDLGNDWLVVGSQGQDVLNPLARVLQDVEAKLVPLEDRLGLSPESRARLGIATADALDRLGDFLQQ